VFFLFINEKRVGRGLPYCSTKKKEGEDSGNRQGGRFGWSSENGGGDDFGARWHDTQIGRDQNGWRK
jgi:hypothetical protein